MAFADNDLIKPSIYSLIVGFIVSLIGIIPIALAAFLFGTENIIGRVILGVLGVLLVFAQYSVTYIFSAMTVYLIFGYLSEGDGRMDKAWAIIQRDWLDILSLAAASTLVNVVKGWVKGNSRNRNFIREQIANLIDTVWTEATYLVLPVMVIEDANLKDGLKRATYIAKNNLLLIGISTIGVRWVTGLIGFVFGLVGIVLGVGIAFPLISLAGNSLPIIVVAVILGVLAASVFFMAAHIITSYTSTAYHTCLYLWARDVEKAGQGVGIPVNIPAPAPLAAVLGR
jgi:hypothetical protein